MKQTSFLLNSWWKMYPMWLVTTIYVTWSHVHHLVFPLEILATGDQHPRYLSTLLEIFGIMFIHNSANCIITVSFSVFNTQMWHIVSSRANFYALNVMASRKCLFKCREAKKTRNCFGSPNHNFTAAAESEFSPKNSLQTRNQKAKKKKKKLLYTASSTPNRQLAMLATNSWTWYRL